MTTDLPTRTAWRLEVAARSDPGRVRTENQDSYGVFPDLGLFVVADGLGGHRAGRVASTMAVDALRQALAGSDDEDMTPVTDARGLVSLGARRLIGALEEANERVREAAKDPSRAGMGSTVAALFFDRRYGVVAVGHVGDSRVFRIRDDAAVQLTEDHTVVQQWVREGRIGPDEAAESPHRHMITQAVGTQDEVQPGLVLEQPQAGDVYVLTSDGVHDTVRGEEIAAVVRQAGGDLEVACLRLIELANERGGRDNSTALVVRCRVRESSDDGEDEPTVAT